MKTCTRCGESRPREMFHRLAKSRDGLRWVCKQCRTLESKERHQALRDVLNAKSAAWRAKNRDRFLASLRRWAAANGDRKRAADRAYVIANKEAIKEYDRSPARRIHHRENAKNQRARRRAQKGASVVRVDATTWCEIQASYLHRCVYCYKAAGLTMDHLEPLRRGGSHVPENIVPACRNCNSAKGAKALIIYLLDRGAA